MGGRSSSSKINNASNNRIAGESTFNSRSIGETVAESQEAVKLIRQAKFIEEGNGNWTFDIDNIGGGQVLEETGSMRALRYGNMPNQKTYSATAWTYEDNGAPVVLNLGMFDKRNQAQKAIKDALVGNRRGRA